MNSIAANYAGSVGTQPLGTLATTLRDQSLLTARNISKTYVTRTGQDVHALSEVSFSLMDGEFVSVVGASGCGKSTLLKILAGILPPSSGEILYGGPGEIKGSRMGVVFQSPVLLPWWTVLQNVLLPLRIDGTASLDAHQRALDLIELVGLRGFDSKYPSELSGGMQQRASIARSLVHNPPMLLMDEPFGALDALTRERMSLELQKIWLARRKTVFFITHSIPEAVFLSDRVLVMSPRPGRLMSDHVIPFQRPRSPDLLLDPLFAERARAIRDELGATADV